MLVGSIKPDVPEGYVQLGIAWFNHQLIGDNIPSTSYQTHWGDLGYWHSMQVGDLSREEIKKRVFLAWHLIFFF